MTTVRKQIRDSQSQEARGAKTYGGRVRPGSGSQVHAKGDVRVGRGDDDFWPEGVLIEYKRTDGAGIRVTGVILDKIRREGLSEGRRHFLGLQIGGRHYVMLPEEDFLELKETACGKTS